jgi:predicted Zn-dependent peptidase
MKLYEYPKLGEQAYRETLPNGLSVVVVPRPGFTRKMAYFVTDFGSIHREFRLNGEEFCVPAGIAHYLEHKMFDLPGRDVSAELAELGANVNAFTSYDMTAYYFSCTEQFDKCLDLLLEFVSVPYFTAESVERSGESSIRRSA